MRIRIPSTVIRATIALALLAAAIGIADAKPRRAARKPEAAAVVRAKAELKIARAVAKAAKAIEACEQAVVDACVDSAPPDGSANCEDENLKFAFAQCH